MLQHKYEGKEWLSPDKLYHGTSDIYLDSILTEGLMFKPDQKNSSISSDFVYLTSSLEMAKSFGNSVSYRKGGKAIVLEVESKNLEAKLIDFDLNICLRFCSECIVYQGTIKKFNVIKDLSCIGDCFMLFNEPEDLNTPVVWDLSQSRAKEHLKRIGFEVD